MELPSLRSVDHRPIKSIALASLLTAGIATSGELANAGTVHKRQTPSAEQSPFLLGENPSSCKHNNGLSISLHGEKNVTLGKKESYTLLVKSCRKTSDHAYKDITVIGRGPNSQRRNLHIDSLAPGKIIKKPMRFIFSKSSRKPFINAGVYTENNKPIKKNRWLLTYTPHTKDPQNIEPVVPEKCTPRSEPLTIGFQEDTEVVFEKNTSREQTFSIAKQRLGATAVRINIIYGHTQEAGGWERYIAAAKAAHEAGLKVHLTIMQTPKYLAFLNQDISFKNFDIQKTEIFAAEVASKLGMYATTFSIFNEPNHREFSDTQAPSTYIPVYIAGRRGVQSIIPGARVFAGELAPGNNTQWINEFNKIPNDGIALHPYAAEMAHVNEYAQLAKTRITFTEYGNPASSPDQAKYNALSIAVANCVNAESIYFYELFKGNKKPGEWDTGTEPLP